MSNAEINWDDFEDEWYEECSACKGHGIETNDKQVCICGRCDGKGYVPHACSEEQT